MSISKLSIVELRAYYDLVQILIDDAVKYGKMNNHSDVEIYDVQRKLDKYNGYRDKIIFEINERLDETFG